MNTPSYPMDSQIDSVNISYLTISAKHSIAQWTSFVFRISSHEARMPCLGMKFRRVGIGYILNDEGEEGIFQRLGHFKAPIDLFKPSKNHRNM